LLEIAHGHRAVIATAFCRSTRVLEEAHQGRRLCLTARKGKELQGAPVVDDLDGLRGPLIPLRPLRAVLSPNRGFDRKSADQGLQAPWTTGDLDPQVEAVVALEVGLNKVPALS
jgi:hypothetical protein